MMRQQNRIAATRDKYRTQMRRQNISQLLKQHRKQLAEASKLINQQQFNSIYPNISQQNISQHIPFIYKYTFDDQYNFRLVVFGPCLYQHLVQHRQDIDALEILSELSQFQQLDIPQTQQFLGVLECNLENHPKTVFMIVFNLLQQGKYCSLLKQMLIDSNFIDKGALLLTKSHPHPNQSTHDQLVLLYFHILCMMATTHPVVSDRVFEYIVRQIGIFLMKEEFLDLFFDRLSVLASTLNPDKVKAGIIYQHFEDTLFRQFFGFPEDIASILLFCLRSEVQIDPKFNSLLLKSLNSPREGLKQQILMIIDIIFEQQEHIEGFMNEENVVGLLLLSFQKSQLQTKINLMKFMSKIVCGYLLSLFKNSETLVEECQMDNIPNLMTTLRRCLEHEDVELLSVSIDTIFKVLSVMKELDIANVEMLMAKIEDQKLMSELDALSRISVDFRKKVEVLALLYDSIRQELNKQ